jgi:hypothetical protein
MMPTLLGRWQTRLALFLSVSVPVSLLFAWAGDGWRALAPEPVALVVVMLVVGLLLDPVYDQLQRFRWDNDWPFALFALTLIGEFVVAVIAARSDWLPGLEACRLARIDRVTRDLVCVEYALPLGVAIAQFLTILALSLLLVTGLGQTIFLRWRFKGGEFGQFDRKES